MDTETISRLGIAKVAEVCAKKKWFCRELPVQDVGIDMMIEMINEQHECVNMIALQVKTGVSYFRIDSNGDYAFYFEDKHKKYWETYHIPVVIVLYDPNSELLICKEFSKETIMSTGKGYKIVICKFETFENFLETRGNTISKLPDFLYNYNYMITQIPFIEMLQNGYDIVLNSEEWVNKSSGRGHISLDIFNDGVLSKTFHWDYWFPYQPYEDVFVRLFPWADFEADDEYYKDDDLNNYYNDVCFYDSEDDKYIGGIYFDEYRKKLPKIRGVLHAGEVATYKLHLKVNDFGRSFYEVYRKLVSLKTYKDIKISKENDIE